MHEQSLRRTRAAAGALVTLAERFRQGRVKGGRANVAQSAMNDALDDDALRHVTGGLATPFFSDENDPFQFGQ